MTVPLNRNDVPTAAELTALRQRLAALGVTPAQATQALGPTPDVRTRAVLAQVLAAWLRTRPRGP